MDDLGAKYTGDSGQEYFAIQSTFGQYTGLWSGFIWRQHISREDDVVDFGCGGGYLLASLPARKKVGIEVNPAAVAVARASGIEVHSSISDVSPESFSKVISSHALEHVANPYETLVALRRLLHKAGSLCLLVPLDDWRARDQRRFEPNDINNHLYAWTPKSLGNLLSAAGYSVNEIRVIAHHWPPIGSRLLWRLHPAVFHAAAYCTSVVLHKRQLFAVAGRDKG
jgi:SAM-dependent methyltransferase